MKHVIYAYTTETYLLTKGWVKVGDTRRETIKRVREQVTAGTPEPLEVLEEWPVNEFRDYDLHRVLQKRGIKVVNKRGDVIFYNSPKKFRLKRTEWYSFGTTDRVKILTILRSAVNELLQGVPRPNTYSMRYEQLEFVKRAAEYFVGGGTKYLLNAKMRFGKCFSALQLMRRLDAKRTLVITYKPGVKDEWKNELNNHVDFTEYTFLDAREYSAENPINTVGEKSVMFTSFQDILGKGLKGEPKKKWSYVLEWLRDNVDLIIIDEVHFGGDKTRAMEFVETFDYKWKLVMSGTPLRVLASGEYNDESSYTWTYVDEQIVRVGDVEKNGTDSSYYWLPALTVYRYVIGDKVLHDTDAYTEEEGLLLNKFFAAEGRTSEDAEFKNKSAVSKWIDLLASEDERIHASPFNNNSLVGKLNHLFWYLPSVSSVYAMGRLLSNHPTFKKYRTIYASANNDGEGPNTKAIVSGAIAENSRTITLSCGKLNTGVTIPQWSGIFILTDTDSPETYWQTSFRGQSSWKDGNKLECFVFDFNPNRTLRMIYNYCDLVAKGKESTQSSVRKFLDVVKVLSYEDNRLIPMDNSDLEHAIVSTINVAKSLDDTSSERMVNSEKIDASCIDILADVKGVKKITLGEIEIAKSELKKGNKFAKGKGKKSRSVKAQIDVQKEMKLRVLTVLRMVPEFIRVMTPTEMFESVNDLVGTNHPDLFREAFGITPKDFKTLVDKEVIDVNRLKRVVEAMSISIKTI